ncbi:3-oxoacyl-[acyl-carrier-protein] synthase III C-terminal domain-containing protein [Streptomyces aidingensis]|uniref:3-oxoacyl-[acyl-carrier-protein] synthase-3 n=1 Tax=Streptomyces aidingensis TaxID=910347 RepID=A0A1I1MSC7_9ACTN|nr:3-oxoacyl-[acyl-carrier-protein] synthase III C-terminal domain-containing protein [Streptomyces aidingensis]SFC88354.1 3-oxoacyl-[acyl-carrier-protein] synthase-3 [Streptomyces aidingensis]
MSVGLSRVAVRLPGGTEPVDDVLARIGCGAMERKMFSRVYGLRDSPVLARGERMEDLLAAAGRGALAGTTASLVLYGHTLHMAQHDLGGDFPDRLRDRLGLHGSRFFGLSHVNCVSVLRGVEYARRYLHRPGAGPGEQVLLLGGDQGSISDVARYIKGTTVSGDGAVGVLVNRTGGTGGTRGATVPQRYRCLAAAGARDARFHRNLRMTAEELAAFGRACSDLVAGTVRRAAEASGGSAERLDWVMPHFSNRMFWRSFSRTTGIPADRICLDLLPERGHNFGGDALMALEHADNAGRLRPGDRCVLVAIGQGAYVQSLVVEVLAERDEGAQP